MIRNSAAVMPLYVFWFTVFTPPRRLSLRGRGAAERHRVIAVGHLVLRVLRPGRRRPVGVTVERTVVEPLRLEKDYRVVILDGTDQQSLGVVRVRRYHRLQAADMGEQRLRAL